MFLLRKSFEFKFFKFTKYKKIKYAVADAVKSPSVAIALGFIGVIAVLIILSDICCKTASSKKQATTPKKKTTKIKPVYIP